MVSLHGGGFGGDGDDIRAREAKSLDGGVVLRTGNPHNARPTITTTHAPFPGWLALTALLGANLRLSSSPHLAPSLRGSFVLRKLGAWGAPHEPRAIGSPCTRYPCGVRSQGPGSSATLSLGIALLAGRVVDPARVAEAAQAPEAAAGRLRRASPHRLVTWPVTLLALLALGYDLIGSC